MSLQLAAPQPLASTHLSGDFECGEPALDEWLKRRVISNQLTGASRTFVVVDEGNRVRGFYAMAAGAVSHPLATNTVRRNMLDPVPVMVLGRRSSGTGHQAGGSHAARRSEPGYHRIAEHWGSCIACLCAQ